MTNMKGARANSVSQGMKVLFKCSVSTKELSTVLFDTAASAVLSILDLHKTLYALADLGRCRGRVRV